MVKGKPKKCLYRKLSFCQLEELNADSQFDLNDLKAHFPHQHIQILYTNYRWRPKFYRNKSIKPQIIDNLI